MFEYSLQFVRMKNILCLVYFAEDVEARFGYGKLNVFVT